MKTEDNYRIKIEEWTEQVELHSFPIKHVNYIVEACYPDKRNWLERIIFRHEPIWYMEAVCSTMDEAVLKMRNMWRRQNPDIKYRYLE